MSNEARKVIVIVGAGFGGLHCARAVAQKLKKYQLTDKYRVLLIDQNDYHTYTPTLYEAATTSEEVATQLHLKNIITFPIAEGIGGLPIEFFKTRVTEIDVANGDIHTETGTVITFNYLVLALGSQTNYFGIPGLQERSLPLKTFIDALRIREHLMLMAEDPEQEHLRVIVGGGGSTGVEIAGEVKSWIKTLHHRMTTEVSIIEGAPTVLAPFGEKIIRRVARRLEKIGVKTLTNEMIKSLGDGVVTLASGKELPFDAFIWTGGVMPNQIMSRLRMKQEEKSKKVIASPDLTCLPERPDLKFYGPIYGLGDAICFIDPKTGRAIPGVARVAIEQANVAANNIIAEIQKTERFANPVLAREYKPLNYPYVIPVGGKYAVAKIGPIILSGISAWLFKAIVEFYYLSSVLPLWRAIKTWLQGLWIFTRNDRLG